MTICELMDQVSQERIRQTLFHLAEDPLPYRKANYTLPGHAKSTLEEADDWIESQLAACGYQVRREACRAQAFACGRTKPLHHWYATPPPDAPFHTLHNLYAAIAGRPDCDEIVVTCSHKDSQSWIDCPGANDNAIGTAVTMELARVLRGWRPKRSVHFLFCNEEHTPWTSVQAAQGYRARGEKVVAVFNTDSVGVKSDEDRAAGIMLNTSRYTVPEGKVLADLIAEVNVRYSLGLIQTASQRTQPGDDDGSFVKAGFPCAIANGGSVPNADPQYHLEGDVPERTDVRNAALTGKAILAAIMTFDER